MLENPKLHILACNRDWRSVAGGLVGAEEFLLFDGKMEDVIVAPTSLLFHLQIC